VITEVIVVVVIVQKSRVRGKWILFRLDERAGVGKTLTFRRIYVYISIYVVRRLVGLKMAIKIRCAVYLVFRFMFVIAIIVLEEIVFFFT